MDLEAGKKEHEYINWIRRSDTIGVDLDIEMSIVSGSDLKGIRQMAGGGRTRFVIVSCYVANNGMN